MPDEGNHFVNLHAPFQLVSTGPFSVWLISSQTRQLIYKPASRTQVAACRAAQKKRPLLDQVLRGHSPLCPLFWQQLLLFCWCRPVLTEAHRHWSNSGKTWMHFCGGKKTQTRPWFKLTEHYAGLAFSNTQYKRGTTKDNWSNLNWNFHQYFSCIPKRLQTLCVGITICGSNQWNRNAVVCYCCLLQL